jgi:hypothetical protein
MQDHSAGFLSCLHGSGGLCSGELLPRAMIHKASRGFPLVELEPPIGIEPMTYSLRVNRSAD